MLSRVLSRTLRSACARPASWSLSRATGGSIRLFSGTKQFAESHEYIDADGLIGITDHAQELLGDICYVDFPEIGDSFKAGDVVGYIESSKTVHDFYAPCDIEIVAVNETLGDDWGVVNDDPEGEGWFVKAAPQSPNPELMDSDKYKQFLETSA